jgi:hypothetical protein
MQIVVQFGGMILYVLDMLDDFGAFECLFAAWGWVRLILVAPKLAY